LARFSASSSFFSSPIAVSGPSPSLGANLWTPNLWYSQSSSRIRPPIAVDSAFDSWMISRICVSPFCAIAIFMCSPALPEGTLATAAATHCLTDPRFCRPAETT
jgi:hypothetical protein